MASIRFPCKSIKGVKYMISIFLPNDEKDTFIQLYENYPESISETKIINSFDGSDLIQLFIEITKYTLPVVASILVAKLSKSNVITIKNKNGQEITVTLKDALTIDQVKEIIALNENSEDNDD